MQCSVSEEYIHGKISDEDFDIHVRNCEQCRKINQYFERAWALLDVDVELPGDMTRTILSKKEEQRVKRVKKIDFTMITQIAAVLVAGIFLGIQLGRHSDTRLLLTKETKKEQLLKDLRNDHYFNVEKEVFY